MSYSFGACFLGLFAIAIAGCSSADPPALTTSSNDLLGTSDGSDSADHSCNVILRALATPENRGAPKTVCDPNAGTCIVVWDGFLDVSSVAIASQAVAYVRYRAEGDIAWSEVQATAVPGGVLGYERYTFEIAPRQATLNAPRPRLEVIPYVRTGSRIFDHNRVPGAFDNYVLDASNGFAIADDETTCAGGHPQGEASIAFAASFANTLTGSLVQSGKLTLDYDLARQPQCESSTYNGMPAWETQAFVEFMPSGAIAKKDIRGAQQADGSFAHDLFTTDVPLDATEARVWFHTSGESCKESWDSDYGQNFRFAVSR